jgi:hypothetical protein
LPAVIQAQHWRKALREEVLLHLARDLQFAVQSLPLRHLPSDRRGQTGNFLGQRLLRGRLCFDTLESGRESAFCELVRFNFVPCD